jgi:hypothetical protein
MSNDAVSTLASEWEKQERTVQQAQAERREKILSFSPEFVFQLLADIISGQEIIIVRSDGREEHVTCVEGTLPMDARIARVDFGPGPKNVAYNFWRDFWRDLFRVRVVSSEFDPVPRATELPELPLPVFTIMQPEQPVEAIRDTTGLPWVIVPAAGLEMDVDKDRFEINQPKEFESESKVRIVIKPKAG